MVNIVRLAVLALRCRNNVAPPNLTCYLLWTDDVESLQRSNYGPALNSARLYLEYDSTSSVTMHGTVFQPTLAQLLPWTPSKDNWNISIHKVSCGTFCSEVLCTVSWKHLCLFRGNRYILIVTVIIKKKEKLHYSFIVCLRHCNNSVQFFCTTHLIPRMIRPNSHTSTVFIAFNPWELYTPWYKNYDNDSRICDCVQWLSRMSRFRNITMNSLKRSLLNWRTK